MILRANTVVDRKEANAFSRPSRYSVPLRYWPALTRSCFDRSVARLAPGTIVGGYAVHEPIEEGGVGTVYRAVHMRLDKPVAVKVLHPHFAKNTRIRERFEQGASVQAKLQHPGIVAVSDFIAEGEILAIVMDLIDGVSLEELLRGEPHPWPDAAAIELMADVIDAVAFAHRRGIIHRDLKPGNILLDRSLDEYASIGRPLVTDFDLARIVGGSGGLTRIGTVMGTVPYMAPEQYLGLPGTDARADVFALGMIFWQLLSGRLPVDEEDEDHLARMYDGSVSISRLDGVESSIASPYSSAISMALAIEPDRRPADADAFAAQLGLTIGTGRSPVFLSPRRSSSASRARRRMVSERGETSDVGQIDREAERNATGIEQSPPEDLRRSSLRPILLIVVVALAAGFVAVLSGGHEHGQLGARGKPAALEGDASYSPTTEPIAARSRTEPRQRAGLRSPANVREVVDRVYRGWKQLDYRLYMSGWAKSATWLKGRTVLDYDAFTERRRQDFARFRSVDVQWQCEQPTIKGRRANVQCTYSMFYTNTAGRETSEIDVVETYDLVWTDGEWRIVRNVEQNP